MWLPPPAGSNRTVIAVTADHGLRTRTEYPNAPPRIPQRRHVPGAAPHLRARAPAAPVELRRRLRTSTWRRRCWRCSAPPDAAARMHGVPVWQRTPRDRLVHARLRLRRRRWLHRGRALLHAPGTVRGGLRQRPLRVQRRRPGAPARIRVAAFVVGGPGRSDSDGQHAVVDPPARTGASPPTSSEARRPNRGTPAPCLGGGHPLPGLDWADAVPGITCALRRCT